MGVVPVSGTGLRIRGQQATAVALACVAVVAAQGADGPSSVLAPEGLKSLSFMGTEFIERASFAVRRVALRTWDGRISPGETRERSRRLEPGGRRLVLSHAWGEVTCTASDEPDRVRLTIEVANTGEAILAELAMELAVMTFPRTPAGWVEHMPYRSFNIGWPTVLVADCGPQVVVLCNEDVGRPLLFGWAGRQSTTQRPLVLATSSDWMQHLLNPMMSRPVYPGGRDRFEITIRFAAAGTTAERIAGDVLRRFAQAYPRRLEWDDRRPIGAVHLSSSNMRIEKNPRGWFNDRGADFLSDEGRRAFRERLLNRARDTTEILKDLNAQGMITWDIEGQEYPHAISYLGDPRSLPPEMEPAADEYFRVFADAGLRTGVTLRPQAPVRTAYGSGVRQIEAPDHFDVLDKKLSYAKERWGCTLFYVDSNGDPNVPLPAAVFSRLAARHPDVLLIPEHENAAYYAVSAPYRCYGNLKQFGTSDSIRGLYPRAFCCIAVAHADPTPVADRLVEDVRRGDILIVNSWYRWKGLDAVKRIYGEAGR